MNKDMKKVLKRIIITTFVFFLMPLGAYAQDIDITCGNDGNLTVNPDPVGSLFELSDIAPGELVIKSIQITNNDTDDSCDIELDITGLSLDENSISSMVSTQIDVEGSAVYGSGLSKTIENLVADDLVFLTSVSPGDTETIDWTVQFDSSAGNEYQGLGLSFDFLLSFVWGSESDGVESGAVLGVSTGSGNVLGATGSAIIIPFAVAIIVLLSVILYKRYIARNK